MVTITNHVDEEWFIGYPKAQRFIEESGIRTETARGFYSQKGLFIFAYKTETFAELSPYFLLNYHSAEELNSLAGIRIYPSVGGFYIIFKEQKDLDKVINILSLAPKEEQEKIGGIFISEMEKHNGEINSKIIYSYDRSTKLFFPTNPVSVKVNISKTKDPKRFLVYGEIFRYLDFSRIRSFFSLDFFKKYFQIIDLNFSNLDSSQKQHEIINRQLDGLGAIKLKIDDVESQFDALGTYEHRASRVDDLSPKDEISYFKNSNKLNTETDLINSNTLIQELENQAGKRLSFIKSVYFSSYLKKYLSISFSYNPYFFVTFNSIYDCPESDTETINHPSSKEDLHKCHRKVLQKQEISSLLSNIWKGSAEIFYPDFNPN